MSGQPESVRVVVPMKHDTLCVAGRRYLMLEFPALMVQDPPQHFVEIGCGCGSSLLPVLKANPTCRATGTDLSPTAVQMFEAAAGRAGVNPERVTAFPFNGTDPNANALAGEP
jgi:methylase of polypeptide subunit release factors